MNTVEAAKCWHTDCDTVSSWCRMGCVRGAYKHSLWWTIPDEARRPIDKPLLEALLWRVLEVQNSLIEYICLDDFGIEDSEVLGYVSQLVPEYLAPVGSDATGILDLRFTRKGMDVLQPKSKRAHQDAPADAPARTVFSYRENKLQAAFGK